ncbi:MAG: hypothetical protein AAF602_19555 [Myxococcota bacterium]
MLAPGLIALMASGCSPSGDPIGDGLTSGEEPWVGFGPLRLEIDGQVLDADVFATGGVELTGETSALLTVVLDGEGSPDGSGFRSLSIELDDEVGATWHDGHDLPETTGVVDLQRVRPDGIRLTEVAPCTATMTHLGTLPNPGLPEVTYRRYAVALTCADAPWDITFDALISVEA